MCCLQRGRQQPLCLKFRLMLGARVCRDCSLLLLLRNESIWLGSERQLAMLPATRLLQHCSLAWLTQATVGKVEAMPSSQ